MNEVKKERESEPTTEKLLALIERQKPAIARALPKHIGPERSFRMAVTAVKMNPSLGKCDPHTFLGALMLASQLGLEVNTPLGHAYIIPYKNVATFQIGYKGLLDLAYRTGLYKHIDAIEVHEHDKFSYTLGLHPTMIHEPLTKGDRGAVVGYYAFYVLKSGGEAFRYRSVHEIKKHAEKYSQAFRSSSSPWKTGFDEMAKKTVLKQVLKYAPMSPEDRQLWEKVEADNGIVTLDVETSEIKVEHADPVQIEAENRLEEKVAVEVDEAIRGLE